MLKKILTAEVDASKWLIIIRVLAGLLIMVHGFGTFNPGHMQGNVAWLTDLHFPAPTFMAYLGKLTELIGGALLVLGLLTRLAAIALVINMAVITFVMGAGDIFEQDQLPFLLLLFFVLFSIAGGGRYSLDKVVFKQS